MPINPTVIDNPKSERVRRLVELSSAKVRQRTGRFVIEGPQAVREAVVWRPDVVQDILVEATVGLDDPRIASDTLQAIVDRSQDSTIYVHLATPEVMHRLSPNCQGIVAVGNVAAMQSSMPEPPDVRLDEGPGFAAFWQVRDPGNAGTVIRVADAAACRAVLFVDECVDVLNPKVIRATAGSLFHIPVISLTTQELFSWSGRAGVRITAADIHGTEDHPPVPLPTVLRDETTRSGSQMMLFGNEARGLPQEILSRVSGSVIVPLYGKAESLNLAGSAAVILMGLAMSSHMGRM